MLFLLSCVPESKTPALDECINRCYAEVGECLENESKQYCDENDSYNMKLFLICINECKK